MKMGKNGKIVKIIDSMLLLLQAVLLIGTYIFHYFTRKKLGMLRWVNSYNMKWQKMYPLETCKWLMLLFTAGTTVCLVLLLIKKRQKQTFGCKLDMVWMLVLSFGYIGFTIAVTLEKMRSYYFISLMLALAAIVQFGKVLVKYVFHTP